MTEHTPGTWFVDRDADDDGFTVSTDHGQVVCEVLSADDFPCLEEGTEDHMDDEARANARLIAAAPELLEAAKLQEAAETAHLSCPECEGEEIPELCPKCFPLYDDARIKRRLAIAKATAAPADPSALPQSQENDCPGHVASENDPKVCGRCGTHIDSLRPTGDRP